MHSMTGLADIAFQEGRFAEAQRLMTHCLAGKRTLKDFFNYNTEGPFMVRILRELGELNSAEMLLDEVLVWLVKFGTPEDLHMTQALQAMLWWDVGRKEDAITHAKVLLPSIKFLSLEQPVIALHDLFFVFDQAQHPLAATVIKAAHAVLQHLADPIADPELHHKFLAKVPYCIALCDGFARYHLPEIVLTQRQVA